MYFVKVLPKITIKTGKEVKVLIIFLERTESAQSTLIMFHGLPRVMLQKRSNVWLSASIWQQRAAGKLSLTGQNGR